MNCEFTNRGVLKLYPWAVELTPDKPKSGEMEQDLGTRIGAPSMKQEPSGRKGYQFIDRSGPFSQENG